MSFEEMMRSFISISGDGGLWSSEGILQLCPKQNLGAPVPLLSQAFAFSRPKVAICLGIFSPSTPPAEQCLPQISSISLTTMFDGICMTHQR